MSQEYLTSHQYTKDSGPTDFIDGGRLTGSPKDYKSDIQQESDSLDLLILTSGLTFPNWEEFKNEMNRFSL